MLKIELCKNTLKTSSKVKNNEKPQRTRGKNEHKRTEQTANEKLTRQKQLGKQKCHKSKKKSTKSPQVD